MSEQTKIQWSDSTWNWSIGCAKVSPGCKNCYAEVSTPVRVARSKGKELWGGTLRQRASVATFNAPLKWNEKPWVCDGCGYAQESEGSAPDGGCPKCNHGMTFHRRRVFSLSLGDWLDEAIPIETLADALDVIRRCPNLDFLLLTKRPENCLERLEAVRHAEDFDWETDEPKGDRTVRCDLIAWITQWLDGRPPANVWIGATVENQEYADKRIPELLKIPAVCRFTSYEPALGSVDFTRIPWANDPVVPNAARNALREIGGFGKELSRSKIDWIICGGESGPHARPFNIEWARVTIAQCKAAGVACFVKQLGAKPECNCRNDSKCLECFPFPITDKKGGDMAEWPSDLRVREFPTLHAKGTETK